jgi:glycine/D-amino acid oxidase-like deaminating enzyme
LTQALVAGAAINGVNCQFGVKVQKFTTTDPDGSNLRRCERIYTEDATLYQFEKRMRQINLQNRDLESDSESKMVLNIDWLVIAAGLGSTPLTASLTQSLDVRPVLGQALQLKLARTLGNADFQPVITGDDVHIVPLGEEGYWIGATVEFPNETGDAIAQPALLEKVRQEAISFCPALAEAAIVRTWSGKRPRPEGESAPIIGQLPGYSNVLVATGHYRNGVLLAPATALAIRDKLLKIQGF